MALAERASTGSSSTATTDGIPVVIGPDGEAEASKTFLLYHSFRYFLTNLVDDRGEPLIVETHQEMWADLMQEESLLCLLAPRDHGKTWTVRAYIAWMAWRHNRDPYSGGLRPGLPDGIFEAVLFSDTLPQAGNFFEGLQSLILSNLALFGDLIPDFGKRTAKQLSSVWSRRRLRLKNQFECSIRAFRTSTRGLHPDLIVCDDVLSERNSLTAYQRQKTWTYFMGTLMPMNAKKVILIGTAQHYDDLLHRLKPDPSKKMWVGTRRVGFRWMKFRAVDWETEEVLWPARHPYEDLLDKRNLDPTIFAREYQNDPQDDASSLFPFPLTQKALDAGKDLTFVTEYQKGPNEFVVLGMDLALSEAVGADYTVCTVWLYQRALQRRQLLFAVRERGLPFTAQVGLLRSMCYRYNVDVGVVEDNGFQRWLHAETTKYPETAGRIVGHRTGRERQTISEGIPSLKMGLLQEMWVVPSGDTESLAFGRIWQTETAAFGWKNDRLEGVGEHDDVVMSWWFADRAIRLIDEWLAQGPTSEMVYGEDVGIERVSIDSSY